MARIERCCVFLALFALLVVIGSLSAFPQTFVPLVRNRSIREPEDLNTNIERIFKTPAAAAKESPDGGGDTVTDLVPRANPTGGQREKRPIDNSDQQEMLFVVRDKNGKLQPVFGSTTPKPTKPPTAQYEHVVSHAPTKHEEYLVLRASAASMNGTSMADDPLKRAAPSIEMGSYPPDYPFEKIERILQARGEMYREVFEEQLAVEALVTRIDSPEDQYLCSSTRKFEYPTYHTETRASIVNVPNYYQRITLELCDNESAPCSNAITDDRSRLVCEQVYSEYDVFVVPLDDASQFVRTQLKFPSCCKCRHYTTV